jgi:hypothetical protein
MEGQTLEIDPEELAPERRLSFLLAQFIGRERRVFSASSSCCKIFNIRNYNLYFLLRHNFHIFGGFR